MSVLVYVPLAALLAYRRPENPISRLLVLFALLRQMGFLRNVALIRLAQGGVLRPLPVSAADLWSLLSGLVFTILAFTLVIFQDGKLPTRGWREIQADRPPYLSGRDSSILNV